MNVAQGLSPTSNLREEYPGDYNLQPGLRAAGSELTINILLLYEQQRYLKRLPTKRVTQKREKGLASFRKLRGRSPGTT